MLVGVFGLIGSTAACGHTAASGTTTLTTAQSISKVQYGAGSVPPELPCVFPSTTELAELAGASDIVVAGTVLAGVQVITYPGTNNQPFTRYALRVRSVLRGPTASGLLTIVEAGGVVQPLLIPGPQVAFLDKVQPPDGLTTYYVVNGPRGTFLTRASGMTMECPHGVERPSDFVSSGLDEATFSDQVRQLVPPPRVYKKSYLPRSSPTVEPPPAG
jgi:hypothetical protein